MKWIKENPEFTFFGVLVIAILGFFLFHYINGTLFAKEELKFKPPTPLERKLDKWMESNKSKLTTESIKAIIEEVVDTKFKGLLSDAKAINKYYQGSPMADTGLVSVIEARRAGIDFRLAPAISNVESGKGRHLANSFNPYGRKAVGGGYESWHT